MENKLVLLTDFGIENPVIAVSNSITEVIKKEYQTELNAEPFVCPISKDTWKNRMLHEARCQYKYCKSKRWNFPTI